jgi:hypothetical protein
MRLLVLGAGVVGVTAAWYLSQDGHEVTVLDRHPGAALETSFANGGQISASYAEPWANPEAPLKILKWLGRDDAPLLFRLRADPQQWRWGLQFLFECLPSRTRHNTIQCLNLALYSRDCLKNLRAQTGIEYDHLERGILSFYTDAKEFAQGVASAELMRTFGCDRDVKTVAECIAIEPALAACREQLAGGIFTISDESGDAQRFTQELARMAGERGVKFRWGMAIESLAAEGDAMTGVRCINADHRRPSRRADRVADRPRVEDRFHAARQPAARGGHGGTVGLQQGPEPRALRSVDQAHLRIVSQRGGSRQRAILDRAAPGHPVECSAGGRHALSQPLPGYGARHAGMDDGVRVRPCPRRCDRGPQTRRGLCLHERLKCGRSHPMA